MTTYRHVLLALTFFLALTTPFCGPGIRTVEPPAISVQVPSEGASVSAFTQIYSGTCDSKWTINITYGTNVSGPATAVCTSGQFSFTAAYVAIAGSLVVTVQQTDLLGNVGQVTRTVQYVRPTFSVAAGFNAVVKAVLDTADLSGGTFVGGSFTSYRGYTAGRLTRLDTTGTPVSGFNSSSGFDNDVNALAQVSDGTGDILVGGAFQNFNGSTTANRIARISASGALNTGFVSGTGFDATVNTVVPVNDATTDLYVGGNFTKYNSGAVNAVKMVRVMTTGANNSAVFNAAALTFNGAVNAILPAIDGTTDVYVGGAFTVPTKSLVRLSNAGAAIASFNVGAGFNGAINAILPLHDGTSDIYVAGDFTTYQGNPVSRIVRLTPTGTVSATFNFGTGFNAVVNSIVLADSSGSIYAVGNFTTYSGTSVSKIARIRSTGSIDASFISGTSFNGSLSTISVANDGSTDLFVGGAFTAYAGTGVNYYSRLSNAGTMNTSFNSGAGFNAPVLAVAPLKDGSGDMYVGGSFTYYNGTIANRIARISLAGALVASFATGSGFDSDVTSILPAADGSGDIFVGGNFGSYQGSGAGRIIRLASTGTAKSAFSTNPGFAGGNVNSMMLSPDGTGKIYAGGTFTTYNGIAAKQLARLTTTGGLDGAFSSAAGFNGAVLSLSRSDLTTTDIVAGGGFTTYQGAAAVCLLRVTATGARNAALSIGLGFTGGVGTAVNSVLLNPAGTTFYIGGSFSMYNGIGAGNLIAVQTNGNVVTAFNVASNGGFDGAVNSLNFVTDGSGDFYAGGAFQSYSGITAASITRLTSAGVRNTIFNAGAGFDGTVYQVVPSIDGSSDVYLGGAFHRYNPSTNPTDTMARVTYEGSLD